jgi:hypothetical protein
MYGSCTATSPSAVSLQLVKEEAKLHLSSNQPTGFAKSVPKEA